MCSEKCCSRTLWGCAISFILLGLLIVFIWPWTFQFLRKTNLELNPSSQSYRLWKKTPMPLYLDLYLFNWTNSAEFLRDNTVKPAFSQVGPFVFREVHERINVTWSDEFTVTYNQTRTWYFVPEKSVDLSTPITNLNVVLTAIAKAAANRNIFIKGLLDFLINIYKEKLIITRPASQWLFDGMSDKLLDFIRKTDPSAFSLDKFGWFYGRNQSSSYDGRFIVGTGHDDIYNLGLISVWNNQHRTDFFNGDCAIVRGSTTEIFPPIKSQQEDLTIFLSDFCSPLTLNKSDSVMVHGLTGYRFFGGDNVFDNGTKYPDAQCFSTGASSPSGVRNETLCRGAPIFISFPHFYLADPIYSDSVEGMKPEKSEHEFYIVLDALSSLPLEVRAQLQINVLLEPHSFPMFHKVPKLYLPMMWFRQRVDLTDELTSLAFELGFLYNLGYGFGSCLALVGLLTMAVKVVKFRCFSNAGNEPLIQPDPEKEESDATDGDD